MDTHTGQAFLALQIYGFYPVFLLAGLVDYLCHRRTHIETTAGTAESLFHVGQFLCLAVALALITLLKMTWPVFVTTTLMVMLHTALAYLDVRYTDSRRYISPVEQKVHGVMDMLPIVTLAILAVLNWQLIAAHIYEPQYQAAPPTSQWLRNALPLGDALLVVGSYLLLAGLPVFEEWCRSSRAAKQVITTPLRQG